MENLLEKNILDEKLRNVCSEDCFQKQGPSTMMVYLPTHSAGAA
jgi:hypothetical protein